MELKEAFARYEERNSCNHSTVQKTCLALRRGGVTTLEQLQALYCTQPEVLLSLRDIGTKRMGLIRTILDDFDCPAP